MQVWGLGGGSQSLIAIHGEGGMSVIAGMQSSPPHHVSHTDQGNPLTNSYKASSNANRVFILSYLANDLGASKECFRIRNRCSSARVKGSFIPTVCKELATLACRNEVSDLSLSDGTDLIMQCLLRTAPLCLLFLLVCPLGSQHSLQCLRLADQHAHLSDRSAGNSGELQQCWQAFFFFKTIGVYKRRNTGVFALL